MFLTLKDGRSINMDHVTTYTLEDADAGQYKFYATMQDGRKITGEIEDHDKQLLDQHSAPWIPAAAGMTLLSFDQQGCLYEGPVIGWHQDHADGFLPITPWGIHGRDYHAAVSIGNVVFTLDWEQRRQNRDEWIQSTRPRLKAA